MDWFSKGRFVQGRRTRLALGATLVFALLLAVGTATAAEVFDEEVYQLQEGEVIADDLIVFGRDIIIDGTVEGDLVAFGQYIVVNGIVTGDVIAAGAEVEINGVVQDDVRAAGAAVRINGRVGDDLFMAGGGFESGFGPIAIPMGDRSVVFGISTGPESAIAGDAYIAGGQATLEGVFRNNLFASVGELTFNATVEGDANLQTGGITFGDSAYVAGNLEYSAPAEAGSADAGGVITKTEPQDEQQAAPAGRQRSPVAGFGWWLMRTVLVIAGIALVGFVLLALSRQTMTGAAGAIEQKPVMAGLYGLLIAVAAIPLSAAFVFLAALFFGWFWGGVGAFTFFFGFLLLAWVLSPVVTGLWLGRQFFAWMHIERGDFYALLAGASVIVLAGRVLGAVPCAGVLAYLVVYLLSFALAAGGVLLSRLQDDSMPGDAVAGHASNAEARP